MLNILSSKAEKPNPLFVQKKRERGEDNLAWFKRHLETLSAEDGAKGAAYVILVGGTQKSEFRARVAQSHLRHDMSPSHFSHVALLWASGWSRGGQLREISLEPTGGFGYPPEDNGIQVGKLKNYSSHAQYPNLAVMRLPIELKTIKQNMKAFKRQRNEIDCVELILVWLAYVWGVGRSVNPLLDGQGTPSAAFIEALTAASGFDLTPGLESRASCPEAIWQGAKWWHEYYTRNERRAIRGMWHLEHYLG